MRSSSRSASLLSPFPATTTCRTRSRAGSPPRGGSSSVSGERLSRRTPPPRSTSSGSTRRARTDTSAATRLGEAKPGAYRVVALHHHMIGAPWRAARKRPVSRRNHVLGELVTAGADLIVAGHIHQAAVSERHEFEVVDGDARAVVVSIAPGLGQPRPRRVGEARGLQVYEIDAGSLTVDTHIWRGDDWAMTARRSFGG